MRKKYMLTRSLAALLALVMTLTLTPAASAAVKAACPTCGSSVYCTMTVEKVATCHEKGIERYFCTNLACSRKNEPQFREVNENPLNHDATYTNNGDGTHSGVCKYDGAVLPAEKHTYNANGLCEKCGAYNYSQVKMDLADRTVPVALNDADAKLTAGSVKLTLGSADITDDYNLTYSWYYQGNQVSTSSECPLPATVYGREGVYYYTLHVLAVPKGTLSRQPVSESCTITVHVEELITASATITTDDTMLRLGEEDYWSAESVSGQIYEAVKSLCGRNVDPDYVTFDISSVSGGTVGELDITSAYNHYTFNRTGNSLDDVRFLPKGVEGEYRISFTAYDTARKDYAGVLTISVQQYVGSMDVLYIASRNEPVTLAPEDFEAFWAKTNPRGALDYVSFNETPRSVDGTLYIDYTSQVLPGDRVRTSDQFYVEPGRNEYGIDQVSFLPGVTQSGYITLSFTAYGSRGTGYPSRREGAMYIFFGSGSSSAADVSVTAAAAGTALDPAAFQKAYQAAAGGTGASFYIQLLDVPASGALYTGRTSTKQGVRLTESTIEGRPFAYNGDRNETISSLVYVPGTVPTESIRYVASSAQGKPLYAGRIIFTASGTPTTPSGTGSVVPYSCTSAGVTFRPADFAALAAAGSPRLASICFTPPAATVGTLYYDRTAAASGTPISGDNDWFSISTAAASSPGIKTLDRVTFVPASGFKGTAAIAFTTINAVGGRSTGSVQITVSSGTAGGGTITPPTPPVTQPAKVFPDVPKTEWYYSYVTDLTASGVLGGYEDGTFRPNEGVSLGQVLKMVMIAAGYPEQPQTGTHWASGYLARAKADNLLPANLVQDLDRRVSRYAIAEIAARAMKLPVSAVTVSPFSDMAAGHASAPYVVALYNIGVLTGSQDAATGLTTYQGDVAIRRKDISAIIWRMQNYVRTGSVNATGIVG